MLPGIALPFTQRVRICAGDRCSAGRNTAMKESDARRPWRVVGVLSELVFLSLARESAEDKRGYVWKRMDLCRDR